MVPVSIAAVILANFLFIFDPESLIRYGSLLIICLVVYGTTGLFFCFFIPSSAVVFAAGVLAATGDLHYNFFFVSGLLIAAAVLGNMTGYWFGRKVGPLLYKRKDSKLFRRQHLAAAEAFYRKYGGLALTVGMFLPIIRTFAPIVAGMVRVNFRRLMLLTVAGSVLWILSFISAGYFIGSRPLLKPWLKYIVIAIILVVTVPVVIRVIRELKELRKENEDKV